jgi:hypothetical protein
VGGLSPRHRETQKKVEEEGQPGASREMTSEGQLHSSTYTFSFIERPILSLRNWN